MPNPLHPAVVHFPLVLAVFFPFVAAGVLLLMRRSRSGRGAWAGVALMAVLLSVSVWASIQTGEAQEDVVEPVVGEQVLHEHEEAAEGLLLGSLLLGAVTLVGLVPGRPGQAGRWVTVPAGLVVLALAVGVGDSGGELVYGHGAAAAYAEDPGSAVDPGRATGERGEEERERHERDEHR